MSEFIVAARHRDGTRNLFHVSDAADHEEARATVKDAYRKSRAILVAIPGGKGLKEAPIPQEELQEQSA